MSQPPNPYFRDMPGRVPYGASFGDELRQRSTTGSIGAYDPTPQIRWRLRWLRIITWGVLPLWCLGFVWVAVSEMHRHHHSPYGATPVVAAVVVFLIFLLCLSKIRKNKRELRAFRRP